LSPPQSSLIRIVPGDGGVSGVAMPDPFECRGVTYAAYPASDDVGVAI
jgi:hypothetical protein